MRRPQAPDVSALIDRLVLNRPANKTLNRWILNLHANGWFASEIAGEFGLTVHAVNARLHRTRKLTQTRKAA